LLRAEGNDEILLISNEKIAYCYSMQMKKMLLSYRSLLEFEVFPGRVVSVYNDLVRQNFEHIVFESMPNMTLLLSEEQRKAPAMIKWFDDYEQLITEAQQQEETVYIFGLNGLQDFILTGNWPGVSDTYFYVETSEQRRQYVEVFYQQLLKKTRKFRLLKNEKLGYSFGMRFDLFGKNKLIVSSTDLQMPYRFIIISELGICEAFQKFFENLMESENLYSEEETVVRFEEMMEILQYKCG
jgi:hypothetical protein